MTLLALAKLGPDDLWANVQRPLLRIWDIMGFMREAHGKDCAANSRETIRRQTIHQFEQARIVDRNPDDADRPTNSGKTVYMLTEEAADVLRDPNRKNHYSKSKGSSGVSGGWMAQSKPNSWCDMQLWQESSVSGPLGQVPAAIRVAAMARL